ncbi:MAG: nucleotide exchange factor GrpE [Candidatus Omnitrophica bacterium]|nr:nucleotide exchange factor GrpE [Candidatus Omnitrophota bacterium]
MSSKKEVTISEEEYQMLAKQAKELEELRDKMLRTAADYENAKKRAVREKDEFLKFANERLIREFLPVLDNLDRAIVHAKTHKDSRESILQGVEIIQKHLFEMLKSHGLERQEVIGKKFDPHQHEALGEIEHKEAPEETILEELEGGYTFQGRLLRPAKVRIAKSTKSVTKKNCDEKDPDIT